MTFNEEGVCRPPDAAASVTSQQHLSVQGLSKQLAIGGQCGPARPHDVVQVLGTQTHPADREPLSGHPTPIPEQSSAKTPEDLRGHRR